MSSEYLQVTLIKTDKEIIEKAGKCKNKFNENKKSVHPKFNGMESLPYDSLILKW